MTLNTKRCLATTLATIAATAACGDDDGGSAGGEQTGQSRTSADQCYPTVAEPLEGEVVCMSRVTNGYCTHHCSSDDDCCAVAGECRTGFPQVCSPFESTGDLYCFLSCEDADVRASGLADVNTFCQRYAHPSFGCRSTGGGARNRKVCLP
jgi:hypothetical protein